jgi:hypothetical protein
MAPDGAGESGESEPPDETHSRPPGARTAHTPHGTRERAHVCAPALPELWKPKSTRQLLPERPAPAS